jgi:hypothetical protein
VYNKAKQIKNLVLSVMVGFALLCPAYLVLSDGNMVGVQFDDRVVMFSKTETTLELGQFNITGSGTHSTIITDLDPAQNYDVYFDGDLLDSFSPTDNGLLVDLDLLLNGDHSVYIWDNNQVLSGIEIKAGNVSGEWSAGTYLAIGNITVPGGSFLDVQPGAVVKFEPNLQLTAYGTLDVNGGEANEVVFTSRDDDTCGTTAPYSDGEPEAGDWYGIHLDGTDGNSGTGQFGWSTIRYGGNTDGDADANVYFNQCDSGDFTNSISDYSANYGVHIHSCSPIFRNTRIAASNSYGVYIDGTATPDFGLSAENPGNSSIRDNDSGGSPYPYQMYNDTPNAVNAFGNYWGTTTNIDSYIYDDDEDSSKGAVDFSGWLSEDPTMVMLSSFAAAIRDGKVILIWRTEAEIGNVGFAIYRSDTEDGNYTRIAFAPGAQDSETSSDYQFTDQQVQHGHTYYYYLEDVDVAGKRTRSDVIQVNLPALPTQTELEIPPERNSLLGNYPNPSNPGTWVPYSLSEAADVTVQIYDIRGHLIRTLHLGYQAAGSYVSKDRAAYWDGRDDIGERVGSGVYFYRLSAGNFSVVRKMVILR